MSDVTLELIARKFHCMDISDLNEVESQIVELLVDDGYLDMDTVKTEDGEFMYNELYYVGIEEE